MQTSNFAQTVKPQEVDPHNLVAICLYPPAWFKGRTYPALAPTKAMLKLDDGQYRQAFQEILDRLDPQKVYEDLGPDAILLCWEAPGKFCHRRLVAEWLEKHLGVTIPEMGENERQGKLF